MPRRLLFKREHVAAIKSGRKKHTIRRTSTRLPDVGDAVMLCVGFAEVFAHARITMRNGIGWDRISQKAAANLKSYGYRHGEPLTRLDFELLKL